MATQEQLETALRNADKAGDVEAAKVLAGELAKARADGYKPEPASAAVRFGRGIKEEVLGLEQLGINMASNGSPQMQRIAREKNQEVRDFLSESDRIAPEGIDFARAGGNIVATAPLAVGAGAAIPARMAAQGAVAGGLTGLVSPVASEDYAATKTLQTLGGAAGGAVLAPASGIALKGIANIVRNAATRFSGNASPQQVTAYLNAAFQGQGIDTARLSPEFLAQVSEQVKQARLTNGTVDEAALRRLAQANSIGVTLTRGQATQDPAQYGKELFLREAPGGEDLASGYANTLSTLNSRIGDLQSGLPQPMLKVEAGQRALDALRAADAPVRANVDNLYQAARQQAGIDTPVNGIDLAKGINDALVEQRVSKALPADYANLLTDLGSGKNLSIGTIAEEVQRINSLLPKYAGKPEEVALRIVKRQLDEAAEATGTQTGNEAALAFRQARAAARERFAIQERVPALRDALDDAVTPDQFIQRHIYAAPLENVAQLRGYLVNNNPEAWNQLRSQVLEDLRMAATGGSDNPADFSQSAFNKALNSLRQSGKARLLFPDEINALTTVGSIGRAVQQGPPGVSRTGLSGQAKALGILTNVMSKVSGPVGGFVAGTVRRGGNYVDSQAALRPMSVATPGQVNFPALDMLARAAPTAGYVAADQ